MNKRIREKLDSWDLRSVLLTISFFVTGIFLFFYFTGIRDRARISEEGKLKGQTQGEIISIESWDRISQSKWNGTKISVDSYKVSYRYRVNGRIFQHIDIIPVTTKNQTLIDQILKGGANAICFVKFDTNAPEKSMLTEHE
jgi:hypothetical protein